MSKKTKNKNKNKNKSRRPFVRRTTDDLQNLKSKIRSLLRENPEGLSAEQIASKLKRELKEIRYPLKQLVVRKRVLTEGATRWMRYLPGKKGKKSED